MGLGKLGPMQGEEHPRSRLLEHEVTEMRRLYWEKDLCIRCISILHQISYATAYDAIHARTWKHLPLPKSKRQKHNGKARTNYGTRTRVESHKRRATAMLGVEAKRKQL